MLRGASPAYLPLFAPFVMNLMVITFLGTPPFATNVIFPVTVTDIIFPGMDLNALLSVVMDLLE